MALDATSVGWIVITKTHREQHVLLVLVDSSGVWHSISVLDHTDRLTYRESQVLEGVIKEGCRQNNFFFGSRLSFNTHQ